MKPTTRSSFLIRVLFFAILAVSLLVASYALAQETGSATESSKTSSPTLVDEKNVKELKEKLATQVAQLREEQTRGFFGEIAVLGKTNFTLVTATGEIKVRFTDDSQVFKLSPKKTDALTKDLKNTLSATVLGLYDTEGKQQTAKVIFLQTQPKHYTGTVTGVDRTNGTITITTEKNSQLVLDYEKTTTSQEYDNADAKLKKSGLSRFAQGDSIHVWGVVSEDDNKKVKAQKIIRIPKDVLGDSVKTDIQGATTASPSATPKSEASSSPKASPKATPQTSPEG